MKEAKTREELGQADPTHIRRYRISSRTVSAKDRDQCTSAVLGTQQGSQSLDGGMGAREQRGHREKRLVVPRKGHIR